MDKILEKLGNLEKNKDIKILLAVESGSREWGFSSEDSDFDVRCVHVNRKESYLGLKDVEEQIELMGDNIDIVSWDIKKFLSLFLKSNPTVSEWLCSKKVYKSFKLFSQSYLLKLFEKGFSRSKLQMHYINLAKENYYKYIDKPEQVSLKKYVYILRGLGCMEFIAKTNKIPPLNWKESYIYLPHEIKKVFEKIVELKKKTEASRGKRYGEVDRWVEEEFMKKIEQDKESFNFEEINDIAVKNINNFDKT